VEWRQAHTIGDGDHVTNWVCDTPASGRWRMSFNFLLK